MDNNKKLINDYFYVTTAIDYASGSPHMGHAYEKTSADVIARWNRIKNIRRYYQINKSDGHIFAPQLIIYFML